MEVSECSCRSRCATAVLSSLMRLVSQSSGHDAPAAVVLRSPAFTIVDRLRLSMYTHTFIRMRLCLCMVICICIPSLMYMYIHLYKCIHFSITITKGHIMYQVLFWLCWFLLLLILKDWVPYCGWPAMTINHCLL